VLRKQTRWISIGNEVDAYLKEKPEQIPTFRKLLDNVRGTLSREFPGIPLTTNFTHGALRDLRTRYKVIDDALAFASFTYYPMDPDFTFHPPDTAASSVAEMVRAARGRKLYIQEVGYSSSPLLGSSPERQARFFENFFKAVRAHQRNILAAHVLWASDLPEAVTQQLSEYYKLPGAERFKAFLATMGLHDTQGHPKPAWQVYRDEATRFRSGAAPK
jgi:hypothetical protein